MLPHSRAVNKRQAHCLGRAEPAFANLLISRGASYTGRPLEVDDKVITLQDGSIAEHFANALLKAIE
jgi:hypothetical protein